MRWTAELHDGTSANRLRARALGYVSAALDRSVDLDAFETVIGELLSNVVRHAAGPAQLAVDISENSIDVAVSDAGRGFALPAATDMPPAEQESGRGLIIVRAFARSVRVERGHHGGACVRVKLSFRTPATSCAPVCVGT